MRRRHFILTIPIYIYKKRLSIYLFGFKQNMFIAINIGGHNTLEKRCYIKICDPHIGKYDNSYMLISHNPFIVYVYSFRGFINAREYLLI